MAASSRWGAIPVDLPMDPRMMTVSIEAEVFYVRSWLYCAQHLTDGSVPASALPLLTMRLTTPSEQLVEELVAAKLARAGKPDKGEALAFPDFLSWNPSAKQVQQRSEKGRKASLKRWADEKQPGDEDAQAEAPQVPNAEGEAMRLALPDAEGEAHTQGNAPNGTERNETYEGGGGLALVRGAPASDPVAASSGSQGPASGQPQPIGSLVAACAPHPQLEGAHR